MLHLAEESRHQCICFGVIFPFLHFLANFTLALFLSAAKSETQKLVGTSLLGRLLDQNVGEKVLVTLDKSLGVDLAMFYLLFSVALDAFQ